MKQIETLYSTFIDRSGRTIEIGIDSQQNVIAEHNNNVIATFDMSEIEVEDGHPSEWWLATAIIDNGYQRSGIGVEMIKCCEEYYPDFLIPNHFTQDGAPFINYCKAHVFRNEHPVKDNDRF